MKTQIRIIITMFLICCCGCYYQAKSHEFDMSQKHKIANPDNEMGIIYFYRPSFNNVAYNHNYILKIGINDRIIGALYTGGYFYIKLDPGIYIFQTKTTTGLERISIEVEPGKTHYISVGCNFENLVCDPVFTEVSQQQGRMEIANLKYAPLKKWEKINLKAYKNANN